MKKSSLVLISILVICSANIAWCSSDSGYEALSFRCGTDIVKPGDKSFQVLQRCGEPNVKERLTGTSDFQAYRWVYGPDAGVYYVLTFWADVLKKIEFYRR